MPEWIIDVAIRLPSRKQSFGALDHAAVIASAPIVDTASLERDAGDGYGDASRCRWPGIGSFPLASANG
jgi:hypothetical protein